MNDFLVEDFFSNFVAFSEYPNFSNTNSKHFLFFQVLNLFLLAKSTIKVIHLLLAVDTLVAMYEEQKQKKKSNSFLLTDF